MVTVMDKVLVRTVDEPEGALAVSCTAAFQVFAPLPVTDSSDALGKLLELIFALDQAVHALLQRVTFGLQRRQCASGCKRRKGERLLAEFACTHN